VERWGGWGRPTLVQNRSFHRPEVGGEVGNVGAAGVSAKSFLPPTGGRWRGREVGSAGVSAESFLAPTKGDWSSSPGRERSKVRKREREQRPALMRSAIRKRARSRCIAAFLNRALFRVFAARAPTAPSPCRVYSVGGLILHHGGHAPATSSPPTGGRWRGGMWGRPALVQNRSSHRPEVGGEAGRWGRPAFSAESSFHRPEVGGEGAAVGAAGVSGHRVRDAKGRKGESGRLVSKRE
jgi:hypothetical protein